MERDNTILIVEDEPAGRMALEPLFSAEACSLVFAGNGTKALTQVAERMQRTPLVAGRGELLLRVDDEASIREVARVGLESRGYRVLMAASLVVEGPTQLSQCFSRLWAEERHHRARDSRR